MKLSTLLVLVPVVVLAALFAVVNRGEVIVRLDPFARAETALALAMPLYFLVFAALLAGVFLGGMTVALGRGLKRRKRLKTKEIGDAIVSIDAETPDGKGP
jgi:hypothetical protein